jgi:predicted glycosyltransferase
MILYYAVGGGLGHLARARRVLTRLGLRDRAVIVTAAEEPRITDGIPTVTSADFLDYERIIVDAFPCGLLGELRDVDVPMDYVARLLQWDAYASATGAVMPHFETTYVVEPVTHALDSDRVVDLDLSEPPFEAEEEDFWLVAHSGDDDEVRHLADYAHELQQIEGIDAPIVIARRTFPLAPLLARATRIVSAAGFNIMLETEPWRHKHHVVPLPRRFDDQFTRAARRRKLIGQRTADSGQQAG